MNFLTAEVSVGVDSSKVPAQLDKVKSEVSKTTDNINKNVNRMGESYKAVWSGVVRYTKWAAAAIVGAMTLTTMQAMKQEDAVFLLGASLKAVGDYTEDTVDKFKKFASSIQEVTTYGDEEVLALMQLQKSLGVSTERLEDATKMTIGLAAATGRDAQSMAMYVAMAEQGEYTMLRRYIPALRKAGDETARMKALTDFVNNGLKIAQARAETASGSWRQMKNALSDVAEEIGFSLLPAVDRAADSMKAWLIENRKDIRAWSDDVVYSISHVLAYERALRKQPEIIAEAQRRYRELAKEPKAFMPGRGLLAWREVPPKDVASYKRIFDEVYKEARDKAIQTTEQVNLSVDAVARAGTISIEQVTKTIETVRHLEYMTRMERIQYLKDYQKEHQDALKSNEEASKALSDEILNIERTRLNQLKVYYAELKEKLEDMNLYLAENFADVARSIEDSMGNAFYAMIAEGQSWKEAMTGFAQDVSRAFARMAAEMAAEAIMAQIVKPFAKEALASIIGSAVAGGITGGAGGAPTPSPYFVGPPSPAARGGIYDRGRIIPFAAGNIVTGPTYFPLRSNQTGLMGEAGPEAVMPLRRGPGGRLGVEAAAPKIINENKVRVVVALKDKDIADAMRTTEGEKAILVAIRRNPSILGI